MNSTLGTPPALPAASPNLNTPGDSPPIPSITANSSPGLNPVTRRRQGKIASLPKPLREQINLLLEDGLSYRAIIEKLQAPDAPIPLPYPVTENNLSDWKDGGYQDWLREQFWQDELRARHDAFTGLLAGADPIQLPEGGLQLAAVGMCELLRVLSPRPTDPEADPDKYIRAANSLARLSRSILQMQQYRDTCARARSALQELKDPKRELSESERRAIVMHVDNILGLGPEHESEWQGIGVIAGESQKPAGRGQNSEGAPT